MEKICFIKDNNLTEKCKVSNNSKSISFVLKMHIEENPTVFFCLIGCTKIIWQIEIALIDSCLNSKMCPVDLSKSWK